MKIKHFIYVKTKVRNQSRILMKFYKNNINVYDVIQKNDDLYLKIKEEDYEKVKEKIVTAKFYYVTDSGFFRFRKMITPLRIFIVFLFLFLVNFFSMIVVRVDVIHSNLEIRKLISNALQDYGIKAGRFKKSYAELQEIKESILSSYKDQLEWLEIENVGMKYVVRVEERIMNPKIEEEKYCHIVASKNGIVKNIQSTKGEILVRDEQYVSEGEILISGEIRFNEEVKNHVCARGKVLAEVWYQTNVSLPIHYSVKTRTGKMRYNFSVGTESGKTKIFKSRLKNYETEEKVLFRFFDFTIYRLKEYEVVEDFYTYDLESGVNKALELADQKIKMKFSKDEKINARKVLKKSINDSTINIEVFYSIIEDISKVEEFSIIPEDIIEEEGS